MYEIESIRIIFENRSFNFENDRIISTKLLKCRIL